MIDAMKQPNYCFYNKRMLELPESDQILPLELFFLKHKLKKTIPPWNELKINGKEPDGIVKRAYALAMLCKKSLYGEKIFLPNELRDYRPFESETDPNTPTMSELTEWSSSLAFFPTIAAAGDKKAAYCNMMFLFRPSEKTSYQDDRLHLCDSDIISDGCLIFVLKAFSRIDGIINGDSWQLAYKIADKALDESKSRKELLGYLITGALDGRKVDTVSIGQKTNLLNDYPSMTMLIPKGNKDHLEIKVYAQIKFVENIDHAWRIITGNGFSEETIHLPNPVKELHVLVGESIQPLLLAIFRLAPQKTILWHSNETVHEAMTIRDLFTELRRRGYSEDNDTGEIELLETASNNMQICYDAISSAIKKNDDRNSIVINTTGGNRLMGFAALLVARDLDVTVIYRDREHKEEKKHMVTGIRFDNGQNLSCIIPLDNRWRGKEIKWDELCDYNRGFPKKVEDIIKLIFLR